MKVITVLAAVLALSVSSASAYNTICMSANTHIKRVYVDGVDYTHKLPSRANAFRCDCFKVPPNASTIAVKAATDHLQLNKPGLQTCETDRHANFNDWLCAPSSQIRGKKWYLPDDSWNNRAWRPPVTSGCQRTCRRQKLLPCFSSQCFWTFEKASSINCILRKCADGCNRCSMSGPGKCDPGQCLYGEAQNSLLKSTVCKRTCKLKVRAWKKGGSGYIKLIDTPTGRVSIITANRPGAYLATIDMSTCTLANKHYATWANEKAHADLLQSWNSPDNTKLANIVGVELGVGSASNSYSPWIALYKLGINPGTVIDNINNYFISLSATLTGVNNGDVQLSNKILRPSA